MKFTCLLFLSCLLWCSSTYAQKIHFTDTTNQWTHTGANYGGTYVCSYNRYFNLGADTLLHGVNFRPVQDIKVFLASGTTCSSYFITGTYMWVREDTMANKIYCWTPDYDTVTNTVLFDYNLQVGDKFTPPMVSNTGYGWVPSAGGTDSVYKIDTLIINGVGHKMFTMVTTDPGAYGVYLYRFLEGVGSLGAFYPPFHRECINNIEYFGCFVNNGNRPYFVAPILACSSGFEWYRPNNDSMCNIVTGVATQHIAPGTVAVYPNPATEVLHIGLPDNQSQIPYEIELTDVVGRRVLQQKISGASNIDLPVSGNSDGHYLLRITHDGMSTRQMVQIAH